MRKLIVWNLMTLDGYFEGTKPWDIDFHTLVWGPELQQYSERLGEEGDLLVFGRKTYEGMAAYWPTATDEEGEKILRKVMEAATAGDARSSEIILSRIWPVRKGGRPISVALPAIDTAADIVKALGVIAGAVGEGEITAEEGAALASVLETKRRAVETAELEQRIAALEKEHKK